MYIIILLNAKILLLKGVYICGNASTSCGLTVTLTKETGSNDFTLEPGALVLADRGCCCIDEFDKMSSQHQVKEYAYCVTYSKCYLLQVK